MKLEKAIEILELTDKTRVWVGYPDSHDAIKLGIEAMKRIIDSHEDDELLPGETKD